MANEVITLSSKDTAAQKTNKNILYKAGGNNSLKKPGAEVKVTRVGNDTNFGRRENPGTFPEGPQNHDREIRPNRPENDEVEAVYKKFAADFHDDISHLIDMRKRRGSDQEFFKFLKDSGHSYYIDYYQKLTDAQEGTRGRPDGGNLFIKEEDFNKFVSEPKTMAAIYRIRQQKLLEQAMSAAAAFSENPQSPEPGMIEPTNYMLESGGPIHEQGRKIAHWLRIPRGRPGGRGEGYTSERARLHLGC